MKIIFNKEKLSNLLKSFYILTKMRIVIFDLDYQEVLSYPSFDAPYCKFIQNNNLNICNKSNSCAFKYCLEHDDLFIYHCHANLVEAMINLKVDGKIVGFIMFGQISDIKDSMKRYRVLKESLSFININNEASISQINYKSEEEISAASLILLALAKYTAHEKLINISKDEFISSLDKLINDNLANSNLSVNFICQKLAISKTSLYQMSHKFLKIGIASYIKEKRLDKGKELLENKDLKISEIASLVGFSNYNYFSKEFANKYHLTCRDYRKSFLK